MSYELIYWPGIQGRGEFVRLVLEAIEQPYRDVGRDDPKAIAATLAKYPHCFAPPILRKGSLVIAQTANITRHLGEAHGLAPKPEPARAAASTIALTIADFVAEVHDTHHPTTSAKAYETQKPAAKARAHAFRTVRMPKFLGYLEKLLVQNGHYVLGAHMSYADLAAFQIVAGLAYAFPRALARQKIPRLRGLHERVATRPAIARYLASPRRLPFNEQGIFRHYPELDG